LGIDLIGQANAASQGGLGLRDREQVDAGDTGDVLFCFSILPFRKIEKNVRSQ
jgi:hypothetical protein